MERKFWVNPGLQVALERAGLHSMTDFMTRGEVIRRRDGKENVVVRLGEGEASTRAFLKRHAPSREVPGLAEWGNTGKVAALGIRVPVVAAAGSDREGSFIMTVEIEGGIPLDDFGREELAFPLTGPGIGRKRRLIEGIAGIARKLHDGGLCHRDFYLCHVFITPSRDDELTLIDHQRVRRARPLRWRWIVKDLASLNYSATTDWISRSDRLRFLRAYLSRDRMAGKEKKLIRRILKKTERIRRHDTKGKKG
jgi:heptose I phosphotransferase